MARFFTQLKFLLWKNFLIRKRQKALLALELVWPLILFFILVLVRTRDLTEKHQTCHYDSKALPSAGFLPFIQSYLCTLANRCHKYPTTDDMPGFVNVSTENEGVRGVLKPWLTWLNSTSNAGDVSRLLIDLIEPVKSISKLENGTQIDYVPSSFGQLVSNEGQVTQSLESCGMQQINAAQFMQFQIQQPFFVESAKVLLGETNTSEIIDPSDSTLDHWKRSIFCNETTLNHSFSYPSDESQVSKVGAEICSEVSGRCLFNTARKMKPAPGGLISFVPALLSNFTGYEFGAVSSFVLFNQVQSVLEDVNKPGVQNLMKALQQFSDMTKTDNVTTLLQILTCGQMQSGFNDAFRKSSSLERIKDRFQDVDNEGHQNDTADKTVPGPTSDLNPNATSICGGMEFNSSKAKKCWIWLKTFKVPKNFLLPLYTLMRGYIFVTPRTQTTQRIVEELEDWLRGVDALKRPLLDLITNADVYQDALHNSDIAKAYYVLNDILNNLESTLSVDILDPTQMESFLNLSTIFANSSDPEALLPKLKEQLEPLGDMFDCFEVDRFVWVDSEHSMEVVGMCLEDYYNFFSGLVFNVSDNEPPSSLVTYKIRMANFLVDGTTRLTDAIWNPRPRDRPFIDTKYLYYGFSFLQDAVDRAIVKVVANHTLPAGVYAQQFPNPCFLLDVFQKALAGMFPFFMVLSWVFSFAIIVKNVVYEKELRLKEVMKVMGLGNGVHWVAAFITSFILLFFSVAVLTFMLIFGRVISYTDPGPVFVLLLVYGICTITQAFLFSTLFTNANLSAASGGVVYFLLYLPYGFIRRRRSILPAYSKVLTCLLPQVALGWAASSISDWEEEGTGVQWDNYTSSPIIYHTLTFAVALRMMLLDALINIILTWYIENVMPGRYGMPRKWYFPLQLSYWRGQRAGSIEHTPTSDKHTITGPPSENMEEDPVDLPLGVCVRHLCKVYSNGKKAVSDLSINFYEGHITSFLGHNGAGKTTTLSMLTGIFPPTSGTAYIDGRDMRTDFDEIRHSLGMCPQYNVLFETLTVRNQLKFYAGLKGVEDNKLDEDVDKMLEDVGLSKKANTLAENLSGGMKRKLSIAVAFIGGSRTVILDEPTAGVDPYARRAIWDMLIKLKKGRTVILSTHHMDEADLLGDRIAIISEGKLTCVGSSIFLKRRFGSGYRLTVVTSSSPIEPQPISITAREMSDEEEEEEEEEESTNDKGNDEFNVDVLPSIRTESEKRNDQRLDSSDSLSKFVRTYVKGAYLVERVGQEVIYCLPSDDPNVLMNFFSMLDQNQKQLNVITYGVSDTTLEEIFLKMVGFETEDNIDQSHIGCSCCTMLRRKFVRVFSKPGRSISPRSETNRLMESGDEGEGSSGIPGGGSTHPVIEATARSKCWLVSRRFRALLTKRFINFKRNSKGAFSEIVLPVLLVLVTMISNELLTPSVPENQPALLLSPWLYGSQRRPNSIFFSLDNPSPSANEFGGRIINALVDPPGLGIRCVPNQPYEEYWACQPVESHWSPNPNSSYNVDDVCYCNQESDYYCPLDSYSPKPPQIQTNTTDILVDVSNRNLTQYLLMTERMYRKKRYGGFSLGELDKYAAQYPNTRQIAMNWEKVMCAMQWLVGNSSFIVNTSQVIVVPLVFNDNSTLSAMQHMTYFLNGLETRDNVKVWFNNQGWASMPVFANTIANAQLRAALPQRISHEQYGIVTFNHPMNYSKNQLFQGANVMANSQKDLVVSLMIILALSVVPASFVLFVIDEKNNHAKHLQQVSGVGPLLYWSATFIWDMLNFMVPVVLIMILFYAFQVRAYIGWIQTSFATLLLLVCYGLAVIPLMYPFTFVFHIPSLAFIVLLVSNFLLGVVSTMTTVTLEALGQTDEELMAINDVCMQVFLLLPQYCLGRGLFDLNMAYNFHLIEEAVYGRANPPSPFRWGVVGRNYVCLLAQGLVGLLIVLVIEYHGSCKKYVCCMMKRWARRLSPSPIVEDADVRAERDRVAEADPAEYALVIKDLVKDYGKLRAVNKLSVAVPAGQCFGLLGVNGAGKTTTFKILTGKIQPTNGEAYIDSYCVQSEQHNVNAALGYCPQFDALNGRLNGRETLAFYARIRGIPENRVQEIVDWGISNMNLGVHANVTTDNYSGGNKRKLSTAIALIGNPKLILLDEPTTGMDPKARRFLWNRILDIVKDGRSVILTSHSMEECETLCGRMGIMVGGEMRCIGSVQHLKTKFGEGYTLTLKLDSTSALQTRDAATFIHKHFPGAILKETHQGMVEYQLPVSNNSLARVFGIVHKAKKKLGVVDYAVSQTTLDQVFVQLASEKLTEDVANGNELNQAPPLCNNAHWVPLDDANIPQQSGYVDQSEDRSEDAEERV